MTDAGVDKIGIHIDTKMAIMIIAQDLSHKYINERFTAKGESS
jgi:hypothetical protein